MISPKAWLKRELRNYIEPWKPISKRRGDMWEKVSAHVKQGKPVTVSFTAADQAIAQYEPEISKSLASANRAYNSVGNGKIRFERVENDALFNVKITEREALATYHDDGNLSVHPEVMREVPEVLVHEMTHGIAGLGHHYRSSTCIMHSDGMLPYFCKKHRERLEKLLE
jgi:hypothetical protein